RAIDKRESAIGAPCKNPFTAFWPRFPRVAARSSAPLPSARPSRFKPARGSARRTIHRLRTAAESIFAAPNIRRSARDSGRYFSRRIAADRGPQRAPPLWRRGAGERFLSPPPDAIAG